MDPLTLAMAGGSILSGLGGMFGAGKQASAASQAGQQSALWQLLGIQNAQNMFGQAQQALSPYTTAGSKSLGLLMNYLQGTDAQTAGVGGGGANLLSTFQPTQSQLENTPGYKFSLSQGTQAAQNAMAGKTLGASGNAIKSGVDYATGLAGTTFQQQLQNYMNQNLQAYNMLMGPSQVGSTAANTLAGNATQLGQGMMGAFGGVGNTIGGATMGAGNALSGGIQSLASGVGQAAMLPYFAQMQNPSQTSYGLNSPAFKNAQAWANSPTSMSNVFTGGQAEYPFQYNQ